MPYPSLWLDLTHVEVIVSLWIVDVLSLSTDSWLHPAASFFAKETGRHRLPSGRSQTLDSRPYGNWLPLLEANCMKCRTLSQYSLADPYYTVTASGAGKVYVLQVTVDTYCNKYDEI